MNTKLNNALKELSFAKQHADNAYINLGKNYSSDTSSKKVKELKTQSNEINKIITKIRSNILSASNTKINQINNSINSKNTEIRNLQAEIRRLRRELQKLKNA